MKIKNFIFNKKLLFWLFITGLFLPPLFLAMPRSFYIGIYKLQSVDNLNESVEKEVPIPQSVESMGNSFFSKISGIEAYKLPTLVCVKNRNKVLLDDKVRDPESLIDKSEAGAMEISIKYPDSTSAALYASLKFLPSCEELKTDISTSSPVHLANNPVFRHPFLIGQPVIESSENGPIIKMPLYQKSEVDFSKTRVFAIPKICSKEFVFNLIIFFLAWGLIYFNLIQLCFLGKRIYPYKKIK